MSADAAWIAFGSAVGGGIAGGIATFWGSVVINRYQFIRDTRTHLYRDVMPSLLTLDFRAVTTQAQSYEVLVATIYREASLCRRTDRRIARKLFGASANLVEVTDKARKDSPDGFIVLPEDRTALDAAASVMSTALATLDKHLQDKLE